MTISDRTLPSGLVAAGVAAAGCGLVGVLCAVAYLHGRRAGGVGGTAWEQLQRDRAAERAGRIRAQRALRELQLRGAQPAPADATAQPLLPPSPSAPAPIPFVPIGILRSCFSDRRGTPRQPLLVPHARAHLRLRPGLPPACLEGLAGFSHCWLLYLFHENTDLPRLWEPGGGRVKAKVHVPRLDGGKAGCLATRSPHRPCPIGLSVARVVRVDGPVLVIEGADVVDGTPVLDVKPYLPFCDAVGAATAPPWVAEAAPLEPLRVAAVEVGAAAAAALEQCWSARQRRGGSLYADAAGFIVLVREVLSFDVRSVHQRLRGGGAGAEGDGEQDGDKLGAYEVVLDGVQVRFGVVL